MNDQYPPDYPPYPPRPSGHNQHASTQVRAHNPLAVAPRVGYSFGDIALLLAVVIVAAVLFRLVTGWATR